MRDKGREVSQRRTDERRGSMEERSTKKMYKAQDKKEQRTDMRDKREQRKIQALFCVNGQAQREICLLYLPCHYLSTNEGRGFPEGGTKLCWLHPCLDLVVSVIKRNKEDRKQRQDGRKSTGQQTRRRKSLERKTARRQRFFLCGSASKQRCSTTGDPQGPEEQFIISVFLRGRRRT